MKAQGLEDVVAVTAGYWHAFARKKDSTVRAFGDNMPWQLGDGSTHNRGAPVKAQGLVDVIGVTSEVPLAAGTGASDGSEQRAQLAAEAPGPMAMAARPARSASPAQVPTQLEPA